MPWKAAEVAKIQGRLGGLAAEEDEAKVRAASGEGEATEEEERSGARRWDASWRRRCKGALRRMLAVLMVDRARCEGKRQGRSRARRRRLMKPLCSSRWASGALYASSLRSPTVQLRSQPTHERPHAVPASTTSPSPLASDPGSPRQLALARPAPSPPRLGPHTSAHLGASCLERASLSRA